MRAARLQGRHKFIGKIHLENKFSEFIGKKTPRACAVLWASSRLHHSTWMISPHYSNILCYYSKHSLSQFSTQRENSLFPLSSPSPSYQLLLEHSWNSFLSSVNGQAMVSQPTQICSAEMKNFFKTLFKSNNVLLHEGHF